MMKKTISTIALFMLLTAGYALSQDVGAPTAPAPAAPAQQQVMPTTPAPAPTGTTVQQGTPQTQQPYVQQKGTGVVAPVKGRSTTGGSRGKSANPVAVDVNTADAATIQANTYGLGPSKSAAIVAEREARGPFKDINDLMARVSGIGPRTIERNPTLQIGGTTGSPAAGMPSSPQASGVEAGSKTTQPITPGTVGGMTTTPAPAAPATPAARQ